MTKFMTAAAWAALVLGGTAMATPPAAEEAAVEATETVITMGETEAVATEEAATIANVTVDGEVEAEIEAETEVVATEETEVEVEAAPEE